MKTKKLSSEMNEKDILTHLGAKSASPASYDKSLLERVPRSINRNQYGITGKEFTGVDIWHHYEVSCLTTYGLPVSGVMKIAVSASSEYIVESKSLKLYFNSFNMERLADTSLLSIERMKQRVRADLSELLEAEVYLQFFDNDTLLSDSSLQGFSCIDNLEGVERLSFTDFNENPALLKPKQGRGRSQTLMSHLLRSNCKVTHQPDWGSIYIHINGNRHIDEHSLLRYLVSFRNENHFHEEICEMVYKRLFDLLVPDRLMLACLYTRRGGIDICPLRSTHEDLLPDLFTDIDNLYKLPMRL
ncbi:MAG: NADPH-dependent 7-cyano-7-deazaguanine reductase QueF [Bacteroidales bacterium]